MSKSRAATRSQDHSRGWIVGSAILIGCLLFAMSGAIAAVGDLQNATPPDRHSDDIVTGSIPKDVATGTNVRMQFIQLDGPRAGHIKVVLTPDDRPLTMPEARSAARQAFLETLNDPIFMEDLKIVTVVVHRFPDQVDPTVDFSVRFRSQGGGEWTIQDTSDDK